MLTRERIFAAVDLPREPIDLPEWGGSAYVRCMTGAERERFEVAVGQAETTLIRATAVALSLCDAEGNRLFEDEDIPALAQKSWLALDRVYAVTRRLSALGSQEALEKNSNGALSDDSGSDLPSPSGAA